MHRAAAATRRARRIVFQNRYYAKPGLEGKVYRWRVQVSDALQAYGLPRGDIIRGAGGTQPGVIWQLELAAGRVEAGIQRQREVAKDLEPVMEHMGSLVRYFEANRYSEISHREVGR